MFANTFKYKQIACQQGILVVPKKNITSSPVSFKDLSLFPNIFRLYGVSYYSLNSVICRFTLGQW